MTVLVLTCEQDVTADMVVARLRERGEPLMRFDPADLPSGGAISGEYVRGEFHGYLSAAGRMVNVESLRSVWVRRPGEPASHAVEPSAWLSAESGQALYGLLEGITARWMNNPAAADRARLKPWQLRLAHRCGFPVPATVITSFPQVARQFAERYRQVVVKAVSGRPVGDPPMILPTTLVPSDADFASVAAGPTLLQRYVRRRADIRLTSVGGKCFTARKVAEEGQVDGRYGDTRHTWQPVEAPAHVRRMVDVYMRLAQLAYGAFDFAEDEEGTWWFLECNQGGQFGFVELETEHPIANAVAAWLAEWQGSVKPHTPPHYRLRNLATGLPA
ncbi:ATP-grasp ribosomal peptide maturase [Streptomyces sp. NPDC048527]|uniref:ATP-grasp ribosomal peptide maturase n=1 Tax=Streptomyces sp. NPDC048527 TaxID=3365568 RepID=UPI00371E3FA1